MVVTSLVGVVGANSRAIWIGWNQKIRRRRSGSSRSVGALVDDDDDDDDVDTELARELFGVEGYEEDRLLLYRGLSQRRSLKVGCESIDQVYLKTC